MDSVKQTRRGALHCRAVLQGMDPRTVLQGCPVLETMKTRGAGEHFEDEASYCNFLVFCLSSAFVPVYPPPFPHTRTPVCAIYVYIGVGMHTSKHTYVYRVLTGMHAHTTGSSADPCRVKKLNSS